MAMDADEVLLAYNHYRNRGICYGETPKMTEHRKIIGNVVPGLIIIVVGTGLLLQNLYPWFSFNYVWPVILILLGLGLIFRR